LSVLFFITYLCSILILNRTILKEKYDKVSELKKVKDQSVEKGREYVAYTHTIEKMHDILVHTGDAHEVH